MGKTLRNSELAESLVLTAVKQPLPTLGLIRNECPPNLAIHYFFILFILTPLIRIAGMTEIIEIHS